jgi:hypothetical protein
MGKEREQMEQGAKLIKKVIVGGCSAAVSLAVALVKQKIENDKKYQIR